jgi:cytoskeleton protein RodZ
MSPGMSMEIRGRRGLLGAIAGSALLLGIAYGWVSSARGSNVVGWVGGILLLVALLHGRAWWDARRPLLDGDDVGIRIRVGRSVYGLVWERIEWVEVRPARRLSDGLITVVPVESARPTPPRRRDRWALRWNAWRYDDALAVPYGLVNSAAGADIPTVLETLAADKVRVVGRLVPQQATVTVTSSADSQSGNGGSASSDGEHAASTKPITPGQPAQRRTPSRRESIAALGGRRRTGRRTELAIPTTAASADAPEVTGTLALTAPEHSQVLPEIGDLHRKNTDNISLIIDTTRLSAQAMSRARRPQHPPSTPADDSGGSAHDKAEADESHIDAMDDGDSAVAAGLGATLAHARNLLGVSIDELAGRTRIRPHVIECLEHGDVTPCGGDVYARGHVRMLAGALGLDPQPLLEQYDESFATEPVRVREVFDAELSTGGGGLVRSGSAAPRWGVLVGIVLVLTIVWTVARYVADDAAPAIAGTQVTNTNTKGLGSPGAGNRLLPGPPRASAVLRGVDSESKVVVIDRYGRHVFDGVLGAKATRRVSGVAPLKITAADGSVVSWTVGGKHRGLLAPVETDEYQRHVAVPTTVTLHASR